MRKQAKEEVTALTKMGASLSNRRVKHGVCAWIDARRLPSGRAFRKTRQGLVAVRGDLIEQYGGDKIRPEALILIETIIDDMGIRGLTGLYIRKVGPVSQESIKRGALALHPLLGSSWLGYGNAITRNLMALKEFMPIKEPAVVDLRAYVVACDRKEAMAAENLPDGPGSGPSVPQAAQDGKSQAGQVEPRANSGIEPDGDIQSKEDDDDRAKV